MKETSKVHLGYIIFILVAVNIVTLTTKWGAVRDLVTYISFAATLASLLLALLAIIYSYFSSGSLAAYGERVSKASDELANTYGELKRTTTELKQLTESIPGAMTSLAEKVSQTQQFIQNMSNRDASQRLAEREEKDETVTVSLIQLAFTASPNGLLAMLACSKAHETGQILDLDAVAKATDPPTDRDYLVGWAMALDAAEIIDLKTTGGRWKWRVPRLPEELTRAVDAAIEDRIEDKNEDETLRKMFRDDCRQVGQFFKGGPTASKNSPAPKENEKQKPT